ncbi:enkurin [Takifugu rubripes]|uniref:Enkurin, TRPC channel interacting protein n=1 Tax=Takifugu rubripes TaxID=31033 RepID=H2TFA1_TAKRU|nr:enkurin [Takifugu rubripes]|eukprot:XP_003968195.1 PREDICTED: enkurin [Takifugu rubripes]
MSGIIHPPESVYNLLPREEDDPHKPPRYVSKFRPAVLIETKTKKHSMRTMGPAAVEAPSPHNYLKSHSKESKSVEKAEYSKEARHSCTQKKPPVPARTDVPPVVFHTGKNFIKTVKIVPMKPKPAACIDIKGYKQVLEDSGLVPKYTKKKDYGEVPKYLQQRSQEQQRAQEDFENFVKDHREQAALTNLSEERRQAVLEGLKKTWDQLHHEYQCLPLVTETMSQKSHRQQLETKMTQVENDIKLIQRFKTIYVPK